MKSLTHWGNSEVTGRGLLALVGNGQLYSVDVKPGEQYIAHPRYGCLKFRDILGVLTDQKQRRGLHYDFQPSSSLPIQIYHPKLPSSRSQNATGPPPEHKFHPAHVTDRYMEDSHEGLPQDPDMVPHDHLG